MLLLILNLFIAFFNNGQIMILCMLSRQAEYILNFNYFLVDLSFKRVQGNIKELEFNGYDKDNNSSKIIIIMN